MLKKLISIIVLLGLFLLGIQSAYALETYVGVRIVSLSDDPAASCVGYSGVPGGYGDQGRIRAISSMPPDFPIYFELRHHATNDLIWSGNSVADVDYEVGDVIQIPETVDLTIGQDYRLFFDVDAIRITLPLVNLGGFEKTIDDQYWTVGRVGTGSTSTNREYWQYSGSNNCAYSTSGNTGGSSLVFVSNTRDPTKLNHPCMTDSIAYNCDSQGIMGIPNSGTISFRTYGRYNNLLNSDVGNFELLFTFS